MLSVRVLGGLSVHRDGDPVSLPPSAARVLAYLAARPGDHARDTLAARFWPDVPESAARASLRSAVWQLRSVLGEDALTATRSVVALSPAAEVDLNTFSALIAEGDDAAAVASCSGELLPDIGEVWAREQRAEHHAAHAAALDRLVLAATEAGDTVAAVRWLRQRCRLDPLDEPVHCALVRELQRSGDRAGAVVVARELVDRLHAELGVAPNPATRAVLAELRGRSPQARDPETFRRMPMFGRSAELTTAMQAWASARRGHGQVVIVSGEAGIGKTRLVTELALRAADVGARVAVGAGVDVGGEAPFALWHELVQELVATVTPPPAEVGWPAELARLAPDLAARLGRRGAPPAAAPELERLRLVDAVLRLVEWAARGRPVLLVAEDVHRADRASLSLCAHIGRRIAALPVLFVLTRRDRPQRQAADVLVADLIGRGIAVTEIDLSPLAATELAAITRSVARLPDEQVAKVVGAAEGNPLLAVEQARALASGSEALPPTVRAVVRAAIQNLPPEARDLVELVAAAGRGLSSAELMAAGGSGSAESTAVQSGLLVRDGDRLAFRHALFAEATRSDLAEPHRRHRQLADALTAAAGDAVDPVAAEVARHLRHAGCFDLAAPMWRRAARHARALGALPAAADFWTEAIGCAPDDPEPWFELAEVEAWRGRRPAFEDAWQRAMSLAPPDQHADGWRRRGSVMRSVLCHPSDGMHAYARARELLDPNAPLALRMEILVGAAQLATATDPDGAAALLDEVAALAPHPSSYVAVDVEAARLLLLTRTGRFAELESAALRSADILEAADRPDQAFAGLVMAACGLAAAGRIPAALTVADRALALTRGVPVLSLPCLAARAHLLARLGRWSDALAAAREQLEVADRLDSPELLALAENDAGLVLLAAGRHREAADLLNRALAGEARVNRSASRLALAEAHARLGDAEAAAAEIRRAALEPMRASDQPWALVPQMAHVQALAALAAGDAVEARRRFSEAADGWRRRRVGDAGAEMMASLVDLGRPPVVGLVDPEWELERIRADEAMLQEV